MAHKQHILSWPWACFPPRWKKKKKGFTAITAADPFVFLMVYGDVSFCVSVGKRCGCRIIGKAWIRVRPLLLWFIGMSRIREDFGIICMRFFSRGPGNTDPSLQELDLKTALKVETENSYFTPNVCLEVGEKPPADTVFLVHEVSSSLLSLDFISGDVSNCFYLNFSSVVWRCSWSTGVYIRCTRRVYSHFAFGIVSLWLLWLQRKMFSDCSSTLTYFRGFFISKILIGFFFFFLNKYFTTYSPQ